MKRSEIHAKLAEEMKYLWVNAKNTLEKKVLQDTIEFHRNKSDELFKRGK